jgi:hypothetical protein
MMRAAVEVARGGVRDGQSREERQAGVGGERVYPAAAGGAGLLGDAIHNLPDVSTSAVVFLGFRGSRRSLYPRCSARCAS